MSEEIEVNFGDLSDLKVLEGVDILASRWEGLFLIFFEWCDIEPYIKFQKGS